MDVTDKTVDEKHKRTKTLDLATLLWLAQRLSHLHPDGMHLSKRELSSLAKQPLETRALIETLLKKMGLEAVYWQSHPRQDALPMLATFPDHSCQLIYGLTNEGVWLLENANGTTQYPTLPAGGFYASLTLSKISPSPTSARSLFQNALKGRKSILAQVALATMVGNTLMLSTSLYSMQVYDRVIPTQGISTLLVLTVGVLIATVLELILKIARSAILERTLKDVDIDLSHQIFLRLLRIRMDQFPASVGTLAAHVRSYESIRSFASSAVLYLLVDIPFAALFIVVIGLIAGIEVAAVPSVFFILALALGLFYRKRIQNHAKGSHVASSRKLGLLVETVEGAESIKAMGAGWKLLTRWSMLSRATINEDLQIREYSEHAAYLAAFMQQVCYVLLVCTGAYIASTAHLTMGAVIACSILSGRVLQPVGVLPGLLVQWGHAKAALENLEQVFSLQNDNHTVSSPLLPEKITGHYAIEELRFAYKDQLTTLSIQSFKIKAGEKIGLLGSVGAGKSTLLKLLAGLYQATQGRVLLDGLDIQQLSRHSLTEHIGFLPQQIHLFAGSLRDNLVLGLAGISEQDIIRHCELTGLIQLVSNHIRGLDLPIAEGGSGVSGGQKQQIALTRLLLAKPSILLLDEPTSAMDEVNENRALSVLREWLTPQKTLILVTHKPSMISLCDRLSILTPTGIALDGPRDAVLQHLQQRVATQNPAPQPTPYTERGHV